jgi:hypothetical protein
VNETGPDAADGVPDNKPLADNLNQPGKSLPENVYGPVPPLALICCEQGWRAVAGGSAPDAGARVTTGDTTNTFTVAIGALPSLFGAVTPNVVLSETVVDTTGRLSRDAGLIQL